VLVVMCGFCTLPSQRPGWGRVILTGRVRAAATISIVKIDYVASVDRVGSIDDLSIDWSIDDFYR